MLRFAAFTAAGALVTAAAAQAPTVLSWPGKQAAPAEAAVETGEAPGLRRLTIEPVAYVERGPVSGQTAAVSKAADGHYWAEGVANGARVRFLVDTGASAVALTLADAKRLGLAPERLDYGYEVSTAGGKARAARVMLDSVSVAGARVADVEAFVIEKGLETSLLGMSYLGRLSRFEATPRALILRP